MARFEMNGTSRRIGAKRWLLATVLAAAAIQALLTLHQHSIVLFPDEMIYGELGRSLAESGHLAVRGVAAHSYPPLYPVVVLGPVYAVFGDLGTAYRVILALNALLMSLAAVPAYLLARRVASPRPSLAAAVLTVAVPSLAYTRFVMTESLFYPLLLFVTYALFLTLENPTRKRQTALIVALLAAGLTRLQAVALIPAVVTAIVLFSAFNVSHRVSALIGELRRYLFIWGAFAGVGVAFVGAQLLRGEGLLAPPPSYSGLMHDYSPSEVAKWFVYHLADLDIYLGFVPFLVGLLALVQLFSSHSDRRMKILATILLSVTFWVVLLASAFSSFAGYLEERYVFYLAPLFFIALAATIERGISRIPRLVQGLVVLASIGLPLVLPMSQVHLATFGPQALALRPVWRVQEEVGSNGLRLILLAIGAASPLLILSLRRNRAAVFFGATLTFLIVEHAYVEKTMRAPFWAASEAGASTWVDDRVGRDTEVAVAHPGFSDYPSLWRTEFFNHSVGTIYNLGQKLWFSDTHVRVIPSGLLVSGTGASVSARYVIADRNLLIAGRVLRRHPAGELTLYVTSGPLKVLGRTQGLQEPSFSADRTYPNLGWSGATLRVTRYDCPGGKLVIDLSGNPYSREVSQRVRVEGALPDAGIRLGPGEHRRLVLSLTAQGGACTVRLRVSPLVSPDRVVGNGDVRALGVHVNGFSFRDPPR